MNIVNICSLSTIIILPHPNCSCRLSEACVMLGECNVPPINYTFPHHHHHHKIQSHPSETVSILINCLLLLVIFTPNCQYNQMREMFVFNFNALSPDSSVSSNRDQFLQKHLCHRVFDNKATTTDHLREVHNNDQTLDADWCRLPDCHLHVSWSSLFTILHI